MTDLSINESIKHHLQHFFAGHACEEHVWTLGPAHEELKRLRVLEFAPGPKSDSWVYATTGAWEAREEPRLEFFITAPWQDLRHVELLFMTTWYHGRERLGSGHTLPIGEPWLPRSACDFFLVCLPYPFGPALEICNVADLRLRVLWLLPITAGEKELKVREGIEVLEQRFEVNGLRYWDPARASVV